MDTMDQNKCALPHFARESKASDDKAAIKMHVTACRVVGVGMLEYVYTNNFAHDANTTVTILHRYDMASEIPSDDLTAVSVVIDD